MSDLSTPNVKPKRTRTASIKKQEIVEITPEVVKKKRRRTQAPTPTQQEKTPIPSSAPIPVQEKKQDTPEPVEVKPQTDETKEVEKANPHIILKKSLPKKSTHVRKWQKMLCNVQTVGGGTNGLKVRVWVTGMRSIHSLKKRGNCMVAQHTIVHTVRLSADTLVAWSPCCNIYNTAFQCCSVVMQARKRHIVLIVAATDI